MHSQWTKNYQLDLNLISSILQYPTKLDHNNFIYRKTYKKPPLLSNIILFTTFLDCISYKNKTPKNVRKLQKKNLLSLWRKIHQKKLASQTSLSSNCTLCAATRYQYTNSEIESVRKVCNIESEKKKEERSTDQSSGSPRVMHNRGQ